MCSGSDCWSTHRSEENPATLSVMRQALADPCWRAAGEGFNVLAFDRICGEE
jgi:hypothetical protein